MHNYLGFSGAQDVNHHLHDGLMHTQCPHQVRVLVEHFIFHDVTTEERVLAPNSWADPRGRQIPMSQIPPLYLISYPCPCHVTGLCPECVHLFCVSA